MKNNSKDKKPKGKKKFSLSGLFRNNKFLFVISLLTAIVIWVGMSFDSQNSTTRVISDIPVNIELSDEAADSGLEIFSGNDETASVTVSGNRVTIGSITKDDIIITAQTANTINTAGTYTVSLSPSKTNVSDNFTITSQPSPSVITVYADYRREKTFDIIDNVAYQVADDYYASSTLSSKTVTVSGPQSEISKISTATVSEKLDGIINSDRKVTLPVKLYDSAGYEISGNLLTLSVEEVDVDISVLPEKTLELHPNFRNMPSGLTVENSTTVEPETVKIAGPAEVLNSITYIDLDDIDFSTLSNTEQTIQANVMLPDGCRNLSNASTASVTVDLSSMKSKTFTVTDFTVQGLSEGYTSVVTTQALDVTVIGPESEIDSLRDGDLEGIIDTSTVDGTIGSTSMSVRIGISGTKSCWAYGSYEANITISRNE